MLTLTALYNDLSVQVIKIYKICRDSITMSRSEDNKIIFCNVPLNISSDFKWLPLLRNGTITRKIWFSGKKILSQLLLKMLHNSQLFQG